MKLLTHTHLQIRVISIKSTIKINHNAWLKNPPVEPMTCRIKSYLIFFLYAKLQAHSLLI
jgi:hypothetical protein